MRIRHWLKDEQGATAVEYAVMLALILLAAIASIAVFGTQASTTWNTINTQTKSSGLGS